MFTFWLFNERYNIFLFEKKFYFLFFQKNKLGHIENQTIPIVLPCTTEDKERLKLSSTIALCYDGKLVALLKDPEFYEHRKEERCARLFGTTNREHPCIKVMNK